MIYLAFGAGLIGLYVWINRQKATSARKGQAQRMVAALLAAAAALFLGVRGEWILALGPAVAAAWLASGFWRATGPSAPVTGMDEVQARALLGVGMDADREAIEAAYHRLIRRVHPDVGGAVGLAAMLNAARDELLK